MKLRLNLSLRRALMAAMAVACTLAPSVWAGVTDARYDLQYYLDFCQNKGMFATGATNIVVKFSDGTSIANNTIPIMPNWASYAQVTNFIDPFTGLISSNGGANLVSSQFVYGAKHVYAEIGNADVVFLSENASGRWRFDSANLDVFGSDSGLQRLTKLMTEVAYTPMASDAFMSTLTTTSGSTSGTWIYRIGNGGRWCNGEVVSVGDNALGGVVTFSSIYNNNGDWQMMGWARAWGEDSTTGTPLDVGTWFGDSGSPLFAWDADNSRFVFVGALWAGGCETSLLTGNSFYPRYNPTGAQDIIDSYTVTTGSFSGTDTIIWGAQDATTGKGTLTQTNADGESVSKEYTGLGTANTIADTLGITFSTEDTTNVQTLELQGNVNMGAGALTFESGKWILTELADNDFTLTSAGFDIQEGAEVTWELTGSASQEIRKVGEGILTISGSGNNESTLVVGGGSTVYEVTTDESGNIIGCRLGNKGETRLNRTSGYAASSVRLSAGVAIIVLMADNQFKTSSVAGDTFTFGNDGGLLNLNGHNLSWGVINQDGSGTGARIGNYTPKGEDIPGTATFTYTGTSGTFAGCFVDEKGTTGSDTGAQLAVVYDGGGTDGTGKWTLTGSSSNAGGFTVSSGTMVLQGSLTPHVRTSDANDWTYAGIETSTVSVASGATFQLSHHALLSGDVTVANGGTFILNQTANAASESISGSVRHDMESLGITSLKGNITLNGEAAMQVNTESPVTTTMVGNITSDTTGTSFAAFTKTGSGIFVVEGQMSVPRGTISEGGLVVTNGTNFVSTWSSWTIEKAGFLAVQNLANAQALACVNDSSQGVLALTSAQGTALVLTNIPNLYIGAYGEKAIEYGTSDVALTAYADTNSDGTKEWLLGGGTGTLNVNFLLTGKNDLIIGNEYSSGTVHLANTNNDFTGNIYIKGTGNMLTYEDGALGAARVSLLYGNALGLNNATQLDIIQEGAKGVLSLTKSMSLNLTGKTLALGASGDVTLTDTLTVAAGDTYRFGGKGNLTVDTELSSASTMQLDGQGITGSSVTFARENAFSGSITAGGGLELNEPNSVGDIAIHVGHESALASATEITLQKGATLYTDGRETLVVKNLSAESGSAIRNTGNSASLLQLNVAEGVSTNIADGVLSDADNSANLGLVKTGSGTLTLGVNASWSGGLTIAEGTVKVSTFNNSKSPGGGSGSSANRIYLAEGATLSISAAKETGHSLYGAILPQTITGEGTIELSSGGSTILSTQGTSFNGTVKLMANSEGLGTRLYVGSGLTTEKDSFSNLTALNNATIVVESGSQARVTSTLHYLSAAHINSWSDYEIAGSGFNGTTGSAIVQDSITTGALAVDLASTVWGNVTLTDDATISSDSRNPRESATYSAANGSYPYYSTAGTYGNSYGVKEHLGGTIRGLILGEGKTLTLAGNEGMTLTADAANTYGDLVIASGNGNNTDKFALRLNGGSAKNQTSTALGTGTVTLGDGLILRLAGTGTAGNSEVVYTYENAITAGAGATLQSYNITNRLTSTVTMGGDTLNLATANGGVLELAGGISGSGKLNVSAGSQIVLGSATSTMALARTGTATFRGTVVTEAGADITLASPSAVATDTIFTGTDSLTLRLSGTEDYTLGSIALTDSDSTDDVGSALTLHFDFTNVPTVDNASYTTLTATNGISATNTIIALDLNLTNDINTGSYTLISSVGTNASYSLADTQNGRLSLSTASGALVLTVGEDNRLYWAASPASNNWNTEDANWYQKSTNTNIAFSANVSVMFDASGAAGSSAESRETVTLAADQTVATMIAKDAAAYYEITGAHTLSGTDLVVAEGGNLMLSTTAAAFTNVQVDAATLGLSGTALTGPVAVTNGGSFALSNATVSNAVTVTDSRMDMDGSTLASNLRLTNAEATLASSSVSGNIILGGSVTATLSNMQLTGEISDGSSRIMAASAYDGSSATYAAATLTGSLNTETGHSLSLTSGSLYLDGTLNLTELSLAGGLTATVWNATAAAGADKTLGSVKLGNNAVLQTNDREAVTAATSIGTLQLDGASATLQDVHHSGWMSIGALQLGSGVTSATLNLKKVAASTWSTVFELGHASAEAGNFVGDIVLNESNSGSKRSLFLILSHKDVAKNAVIRFSDALSGDAHVGLGINADGATIAGLNSIAGDASQAKLFSGSIQDQQAWNTSSTALPTTVGDATRTLTINTAAGTTHTFYGEVLGNLNLVKSGAGTQKLLGSSSNFSGTVEVQAGTLALGAADSLGTLGGLSLAEGSTLDLSAIDFGASSGIAVAAGAAATFDSGAHVSFANMEQGMNYTIFSLGSGSTLTGWDSLTTANFTVNGMAMTDMGRVQLALGNAGTFSYYIDAYDLLWNGGESGGTWNRTESNTAWQRIIADSVQTDSPTYFANSDNVTFDSTATVSLGESVIAGSLTVKNDAQLTLHAGANTGYAVSTDLVTIESGSKLTVDYASVLRPVEKFDIASGAAVEMYVPGSPTFTAEVSGEGSVIMTGSGTLTWNTASDNLSIAHLNIANNGTFTTADNTLGVTGGTITLSGGGKLYLNLAGNSTVGAASTTQTVLSTIVADSTAATADSPVTSIVRNDASGESMIRDLAGIRIAANNVLQLQQKDWNTIWQIGDLSGAGKLEWSPTTTHNYTSRLILRGDGSDFTGEISVNRSSAFSGRPMQVYVELADDAAAQGALLTINSSGANSRAALAINTENATIRGLNGNAQSHLYAGAARTDASLTDAAASTASNTLTIAGSEDYTFAGTVGTASETEHLSLKMVGSGSQTFSGATHWGSLTVQDGSLSLTGAASVSDSVSVSGGRLVLNATSAALLGGTTGGVTLSGGVLDLSAITFGTDATNAIAISSGSVAFSEGASLALGQLTEGTTYQVFSNGTTTTLTGWNADTLDASSVYVNGALLSDTYRNVTLTYGESGTFSYSAAVGDTLTWVGGASGTWDLSSANWDADASSSADAPIHFLQKDNAIFNSGASVTLSTDIIANTVTLAKSSDTAEDFTVSLNESSGTLSAMSIAVGEGTTLEFATAKAGYTANVSGAGTVVLTLTDAANTLDLGESFTGETYIKGGKLNTPAHAGSILRLADGVTLVSTATDVTANVVLEGDTDISGQYTSRFMGTVTGEGTLKHSGNGYYEFHDEVNVGGLKHIGTNAWGREMFMENATIDTVDLSCGQLGFRKDALIGTLTLGASTNFVGFGWKGEGDANQWASADNVISTGKHTIGTADVKGGTVYFNGATTITSATFSGGTTHFTNSAEITGLTVSGGTVNFNGATTLPSVTIGGGTTNFATSSLTASNGITHNGGNLNFKLASGATETSYNIGSISGSNQGTLTVDEGVTLNATNVVTPKSVFSEAVRSFVVNGEMNLSGGMDFQFSNGISFSGSGVLNVAGNIDAYICLDAPMNISVKELNVAGNLNLVSYWNSASVRVANFLEGNTTTVKGHFYNTSNGYGDVGSTLNLNISGGHLILEGGATMSRGSTVLTSGTLEQAGGTANITNTFNMTDGELVVSGGVLNLNPSAVTATGGAVSVTGGEMVLSSTAATGLLGGVSSIGLSGGVLDLSAITFTADGGIALGGAMSVSGNGVIELGSSISVAEGASYAIFDLSNGSVTGWDKNHIVVNGVNLSRYEDATATITEGANASISFASTTVTNYADLLWVGDASGSGTWDHSSANWDRTTDDSDILFSFADGDSVTFNKAASVTLGTAISANTVTLAKSGDTAEDFTVTLNESSGALSATSISVGAGTTLEFETAKVNFVKDNISGTGTVVLDQLYQSADGEGWGAQLKLANFEGTTYVQKGKFDLYQSTAESGGTATDTNDDNVALVGGTLHLGSGAHMQITGAKTVVLNANVILDENTTTGADSTVNGTEVHHNSSDNVYATLIVNGTVSGTGTWYHKAGGTLTFDNSVTLGGFTAANGENNFNGATTLNLLTLTGGTVNFNGTTALAGADGTATVLSATGGTINSSGTTTITGTARATTLNVTGGSLKVNFTGVTSVNNSITSNENCSFTVGTLNYTGGTLEMSGTVNITTLNIGDGLTATVYNATSTSGSNKTFGSITLGNNAILQTNDRTKNTVAATTDFGAVTLNGTTATIQDVCHAGYYHIDTLNVGGNVESSTLKLVKNASSQAAAVFDLGGDDTNAGNFVGRIELSQTNTSNRRSAYLVLSNSDIAQNAVISLQDIQSSQAYLGLGIHASTVNIAGLESVQGDGANAKLFSGTIGYGQEWSGESSHSTAPTTVGDAIRTLNITTTADRIHNFYGEVLDNVNLVIAGEGRQNFRGESSSFNGTVAVTGGTVGFDATGSSLLEGASSFTLNGGVLDLSEIAFTTDGTAAIALASGAAFTFTTGTIALGDLQADTTYQIFDLTSGGTLRGWDTDTLSVNNFTLNGTAMNTMDDVTLTLGADGTFAYSLTSTVLYWAGGESGTWNTTDAVWDADPADADNALSAFATNDDVAFADSASVALAGSISADSVKVEGANTVVSLTSGSLTTSELQLEGKLDLASGVTLTLNTTKETAVSGITGSGTLVKTGTGVLNLGDAALHTLDFTQNNGTYAQDVGQLNINGKVEVSELLRIGAGTLTISGSGAVTTKVFQAVANGKNGNSVINIEGGSLTITGSDDVDGEATDFILGWWHNSTTSAGRLTLTSGSLTAENTSLYMGYDSPGVFKALGGKATLKGIRFRANTADADQFELGEAESGSAEVTIGSTGIVGMGSNDIIKLGEGTLKASADFAITAQSEATPSVSLIGTTTGTIFDTNTHNITVNTVLSGGGKLVKNGEGSLIFTTDHTYTGSTTIAAGKLILDLGTVTSGEGDEAVTTNGVYTLDGAVSGAGTLQVNGGTTLVNNSQKLDAALVLNGGNATITGGSVLSGDVTIKSGSTLTINATIGSDHFEYGDGHVVTVETGGILAIGSNRETFGNWTLDVKGGTVTGTGSIGDVGTAALDYHNDKTIKASAGNGEIAAAIGVRTGKTVTFDVDSSATLTVSQAIVGPGSVKKDTGTGDLIFTTDHTYTGSTTIAAGKLILDLGTVTTGEGDEAVTTNGVYTLDGAVSGAGTLQVNGGTTLVNNAKVISADLVLNGGNATLSGGKVISGDITIGNGSVLTAAGDSDDTLIYTDSSGTYTRTLTIESGGELALGNRRWSMGNDNTSYTGSVYNIVLNGGKITGNGTVSGDVATGNLDFFENGKITATGTTGEIAAEIRVRHNDNKLDLIVTEASDQLEVSGRIVGDGGITKSGAGTLVLSGNNTYVDDTQITGGTLELQGAGQIGAGDVSIAAGAELTAATTATVDDEGNVTESETWARVSSTSETEAATVSGASITQTVTETSKTLRIASRSTDDTPGTMTNSLVQIAAGAALTVDSMIISESSRIQGQGTTYAARSATAESGSVTLTNSTLELKLGLDGNAEVSGESASKALTLYAVGSDTSEPLSLAAATVKTVTSDALSNVLLTSGSDFVVDFSALFTWEELKAVDMVQLSFDNVSFASLSDMSISGLLGTESLTAYYTQDTDADTGTPNVGLYFDVRSIPEPTTTTLSMLALAALAVRRRRK